MSIADELERLKNLHESGSISTEEYRKAKNVALNKANRATMKRPKERKKYGCFQLGCMTIIFLVVVRSCSSCLDDNNPVHTNTPAQKVQKTRAEKVQGMSVKVSADGFGGLLHHETNCGCNGDLLESDGQKATRINDGTELKIIEAWEHVAPGGPGWNILWLRVQYKNETGWISEHVTDLKSSL